jgi:hypothetical protein
LAALADYQKSDLLRPLDQLLLDLAAAVSRTPAVVTLAEVAATIAWEKHRARLNRTLGVRAVGLSDGAGLP